MRGKMNVLLIDDDNCGLAFAWRCAQAGHKVRWFIKKKPDTRNDNGEGFKNIEKIENWVSSIQWADLVFTTGNSDYLKRLDVFKKRGAPIFAPSQQSADLEIKRGLGMKFLEKNGIEVPPYHTFKNLKEAEKFVWDNPRRFVFKTMGDNDDKSLSYCSKSPADLIEWLQGKQREGLNPKGEVMLQEFIKGIEMGVSRWMGLDGWIGEPCENFEHKKLMPSNYGVNTGEMGTVLYYTEESKLFDEVLKPLEKALLDVGHIGATDMNCIIDEKGKAWPLEFTNRPGWPLFNLMIAAHKGDPVQWMLDAVHGKDSMEFTNDIGICYVVAQPPFPFDSGDKEETSKPIYGVTQGNSKYLQPQSVKIEKKPDMQGDKVVIKPTWTTTGNYVLVVTGFGNSVKQAIDRAKGTIDQIYIPNMIVRDDIGEGLKKTIPELQKLGYAKSVNFGE